MALNSLETAIYNLAELAAVEDKSPFATLRRKPGAKPASGGDDNGLVRLPGRAIPVGRAPGED